MRLLTMTSTFIALAAISNVAPGKEGHASLPWSAAIGITEGVVSIEAHASVSVSDGVEYEVQTAWRNNERSIFHRIYADRSVTMGREGVLVWSWDGQSQTTLAPALGDVVTGHQFHARLLFMDGIDRSAASRSSSSEFCDCEGYRVTSGDGVVLTMHYESESRQPRVLVMDSADFGRIIVRYDDWRPVDSASLPWKITIDHEGRRFDYRFKSIVFNQRELWDRLHPPIDKLTPEQQLLAMHRLSIDAHIESDISLLAGRWADSIVNVYGGEASMMPGPQMEEFLGRSLAARRHSVYRERLEDGEPTGESFAFQSAWLATYEKPDAGWKMTAIASGVEYRNQ